MRSMIVFSMLSMLMLLIPCVIFGTSDSKSCENGKPLVIVMLGAPGAGKGSQAVRLSESLNLPHISTGDLFRENIKKNTELGKKAKAYIDQGQLVPDELVLDMLFDRVSKPDTSQGYILDGSPRTIPQAEAIDKRLSNSANILVISLDVPDSLIVDRITGRYICEKCATPYHNKSCPPKESGLCDRCGGKLIQRKDDAEAVVKERLEVYHKQTEPLKAYYEKKGSLISVDGTQSVEAVFSDLQKVIQNYKTAICK